MYVGDFEFKKDQALKIAKQLGYKANIIEKIKRAENETQLTHALTCGRLGE